MKDFDGAAVVEQSAFCDMDRAFGVAVWLLVLAGTLSTCRAQTDAHRLPNTTEPLRYSIDLTVYPDQLSESNGLSSIWIRANEPTDTIVIHCPRLTTIGDPIEVYENGTRVDIYESHQLLQDGTDRLIIYTNITLDPGKVYMLEIWFVCKLKLDAMVIGSFVSGGVRRSYVTTGMEPINARQLFPCYDEPDKIVPIELRLYVYNVYNATSNGGIVENELIIDSFREILYEETPRMPISSLNFVSSRLPKTTTVLNGKDFSIQARKEALADVDFAMDIGRKSLEEFEAYFNISYPMSKMDMVALADYRHDSMGGWGMVIYREEMLVSSQNHTPAILNQKIASQISYENAKMWFGNQVNPAWWNFIWMKEGLSTFFGHLIVDKILKWNTMEHFVVDSVQKIMHTDSFDIVGSLSSNVETAEEIKEMDLEMQRIKGAAIMRMLYHVLGEDVFHKAVQNYLKNSTTGTVDPDYLFDQFQLAIDGTDILPSGVTVDEFLSTWINKTSYPLLEVRKFGQTTLEMRQKRYRNNTVGVEEKWWIPISVVASSSINFDVTSPQNWLEPNTRVNVSIKSSDVWYLLNPQQTGYYRVLYPEDNWAALTKYLNSSSYSKIHPLNRAQLLSDALELAKAQQLSYEITMNLITYLHQETDHIPWTAARSGLIFLKHHMMYSKQYNKLMWLLSSLIEKFYDAVKLGSGLDESNVSKIRRATALELAYEFNLAPCVSEIDASSFEHFVSSNCSDCDNAVDPNIRTQVYCHGLKWQHVDFDGMWRKYSRVDMGSEESIILDAMGCTPAERDIQRYLEKSIAGGYAVKNHNRHRILNSVIKSGSLGRNMTLDLLIKNFTEIQSKFKSPSAVVSVINTLAEYINSNGEIDKFMTFIRTHNQSFTPSQKREVEKATTIIDENRHWKTSQMKYVDDWLENYPGSSAKSSISLFAIIIGSLIAKFVSVF